MPRDKRKSRPSCRSTLISPSGCGVIDADTFDKMKKDTPGHMYDGARSKDLTDRNFICGKFEGVDFRRAAWRTRSSTDALLYGPGSTERG
jgi:hypothetical protein